MEQSGAAAVLSYRANVMPFTSTDADNLRRAIADGKGARSMSFSDQSVTFNSIEDMIKLLAIMEADAANAAGTRRSYRVGTTNKGA
jgi:hypothetical protein